MIVCINGNMNEILLRFVRDFDFFFINSGIQWSRIIGRLQNLEFYSQFSSFLTFFKKIFLNYLLWCWKIAQIAYSIDYFNIAKPIEFQFCRSYVELQRKFAVFEHQRPACGELTTVKRVRLFFYDANKKDGVCCSSHQQKASHEFFAKISHF